MNAILPSLGQKLALFALVFGGLILRLPADQVWTNTVEGEWNTAGNWFSPPLGVGSGVPGTTDAAFLTNQSVSHTVDYTNVMTASNILSLTVSTVAGKTNMLNINTSGFMAGSAVGIVNPVSLGVGAVVNVNTGGVFTVAAANSTPIFLISGNSTDAGILNLQGGIVSNQGSAFYVGQNGQGVLNLLSGSFVDSGGNVRVQAAASQGLLNIYGGSFELNAPSGVLRIGGGAGTVDAIVAITNGMLAQNASGGAIFIGVGSKRGILNISGGAVTNKGSLSIGLGATGGTTGLVIQTGGLFIQQGSMILGRPQAATDNTIGLFTMGGGVFSNTGALYLGGNRFGPQVNGFLTMTGGIWYQAGSVEIGSSIGFSANHTNGAVGRIDISGGSFLDTGDVTLGKLNGSTGTITMAGGTFVVTNSAKTALLNVGPVGSGTLILSNGATWADRLVATNSAGSVVQLTGGALNTRSTTVSNGTQFIVGDGASTAAFNLIGGTHSFGNGIQISANATLAVTNATATVAASTVTNLGTVSVMNGNAIFNGNVVNLGAWVSDPSTNTINGNYTVGPTATVVAAAGDLYAFGGNFVMQSTNHAFDMHLAQVVFATNSYGVATTTPNHIFDLTGSGAAELGRPSTNFSYYTSNFSIGILSIALSNNLTVTGAALTNALYVGWLDLSAWNTNAGTSLTNTLSAALTLPNINLYYDPFDSRNAYLQGSEFNLWSGGLLIPIPEPGSLALMAGSLLVMGMAIRSRRKPPLS